MYVYRPGVSVMTRPKCSPSVLCSHSYITSRDPDVSVGRESRDLERIACLNSADITVTTAPDSVRFQHSSGGWIDHHKDNITHVEVLLFKAYDAIEAQIRFGDCRWLISQEPVDMDTNVYYEGVLDDRKSAALIKLEELRETVTRRHLAALAARIPVYAQDHETYPLSSYPATEFDQFKERPVLALADGGAIDLSASAASYDNGGVLAPESYGLLHRTHHDRGAIPHDPEILIRQDSSLDLPRRLLESHYPPEFMQLAAYLLAYPADDIISVLIGESATGKTTFWQWVGWATGSVEVSDMSLLTNRSQFTPMEAALSRSHAVVLDEGDASKAGPIPFGQLNKATAERFDVNVKFGGFFPGVPRLGTLVLVGNDWPSFDSTTPGLERRIGWAWDKRMPGIIDKAVYDALSKSHAAHQYMLALLVSRARKLSSIGIDAARKSLMTEEVALAHKRMMDATTSSLKQALDDFLERGGPNDSVPAKRVQNIVKDAELGKVASQEIKRVMAMYGAVTRTQRRDSGIVRVWVGVRLRDSTASAIAAPGPDPQLPCPSCGHEGSVQTKDMVCADTAQCKARSAEKILTGEWV